MASKKILWLCSWYPTRSDPFNGDFVQRHARAAALYNDIHVIHVTSDSSGRAKKVERTKKEDGKLTEEIIYFKKSSSTRGRLIGHFRMRRLFKQAIRRYLEENGRPDLVHVQVPVWAGLGALWLKRRTRVPFIVTEHWGIYNEIEENNYQKKSVFFRRCSRSVFRDAEVFTSASRFLAEGVNRLVVRKEYVIVPNVVDCSLFNFQENKSPVFRFIHVSNMVGLKNPRGILRAFSLLVNRFKNAELVMVGDRDPAIREFASGLSISPGSVSFRGEVPYAQVAKEMQQAHCLVLFSNIENSPCVIGEALCCGLPVIATPVGGIPELVNEGNALLTAAGNEELLAESMEKMMFGYQNYDRLKISEEAGRRFNYDSVGKQFDGIYESVRRHFS